MVHILTWLIHSRIGINVQKKKYERLHKTNMSTVCTQEHEQNAKILNMKNSLKEDIQKVWTEDIQKVQKEAGPHTGMAVYTANTTRSQIICRWNKA